MFQISSCLLLLLFELKSLSRQKISPNFLFLSSLVQKFSKKSYLPIIDNGNLAIYIPFCDPFKLSRRFSANCLKMLLEELNRIFFFRDITLFSLLPTFSNNDPGRNNINFVYEMRNFSAPLACACIPWCPDEHAVLFFFSKHKNLGW